MSSRRAATAKTAVRRSPAPRPAAKPAAKVAAPSATDGTADADARKLAAAVEQSLKTGRLDALSPAAFQVLLAALCKTYGAHIEAGGLYPVLADRNSVSPTDIMTMTSALLKSANLAVFELGMWQSWTGR
jgi:hypothetical protein